METKRSKHVINQHAAGLGWARPPNMSIAPGDRQGGPRTRHRGADRWLLVTQGKGAAIVNGHETQIVAGSIVMIEAGDTHEIRNVGLEPLELVNMYLPAAE